MYVSEDIYGQFFYFCKCHPRGMQVHAIRYAWTPKSWLHTHSETCHVFCCLCILYEEICHYNAVHVPESSQLTFPADAATQNLLGFSDEGWYWFILASLVWGWKWCTDDLSVMIQPRKSSLSASYWASRFLQCQDTSASVNMPADIYFCWSNFRSLLCSP